MNLVRSLAAALVAAVLAALASVPAVAEPMHPTLAEVEATVDILRFRDGMIADAAGAIATLATGAAAERLAAMEEQMNTAGSGSDGWRYLLGTSVFTVAGIDRARTLAVFYNPWIDIGLFTVWQGEGGDRRVTDAEWLPGDVIRQQAPELDARPLWLREPGYPPQALIDQLVDTVRSIEARFPAQGISSWRSITGTTNTAAYDEFVAPILAMRLYEAQLRLKALAIPAEGEDPLLMPLRTAVADLLRAVGSGGFATPLAGAAATTGPMRQALAAINPQTLRQLAPVAFVAVENDVTIFLASAQTADFAVSARLTQAGGGYRLEQLEYLPYAAMVAASGPDR